MLREDLPNRAARKAGRYPDRSGSTLHLVQTEKGKWKKKKNILVKNSFLEILRIYDVVMLYIFLYILFCDVSFYEDEKKTWWIEIVKALVVKFTTYHYHNTYLSFLLHIAWTGCQIDQKVLRQIQRWLLKANKTSDKTREEKEKHFETDNIDIKSLLDKAPLTHKTQKKKSGIHLKKTSAC